MANLAIDNINGGVVFTAKVVPAGSKTALAGILGDMLKIKVSSPPEKGKANQCMINFLATKLDVKKHNISIISGQSNPVKQVQILSISPETLLEKLNLDRQD